MEEQHSQLAEEKKKQLLELSASFGSGISRNTLARRNWIRDLNAPQGNDILHDLLSKLQTDPNTAIKTVADSGYYSWFYKCLPLQRGMNYLVLGATSGSVAIFSADGIDIQKLPEISRRILIALKEGPTTKEELVVQVWGYEYSPLRHDSLVYTAMSTLRKNLGEKHFWVQHSEHGYHLQRDVAILEISPQSRKSSTKIGEALSKQTRSLATLNLNFRQLQVLDYLKSHRFISTREYRELFDTTEITASRDLSSLNKIGHLLKVGQGRSTHYTLLTKDAE